MDINITNLAFGHIMYLQASQKSINRVFLVMGTHSESCEPEIIFVNLLHFLKRKISKLVIVMHCVFANECYLCVFLCCVPHFKFLNT